MALRQDEEWVWLSLLSPAALSSWTPPGIAWYSRQDGGERDHLGSKVRDIGQEEDEERFDDAHTFGEPRDQGQEEGKEQPHSRASQAHQEEGSWWGEKTHLHQGWPSPTLPPQSPPKLPTVMADTRPLGWRQQSCGAQWYDSTCACPPHLRARKRGGWAGGAYTHLPPSRSPWRGCVQGPAPRKS